MTLTDNFGRYQEEDVRTCDDGRQNGQRLKNEIPLMFNDMNLKKSQLINALKDTSRVSTSQRLVIEVFAWSSVLVLASSIGSLFGGYIFSPMIGSIFGKLISCLIAYIVIPVASHLSIRKKERDFVHNNNIRWTMLAMSVLQGVFAGYTINHRYIESQPVAFVTPVAISIGYGVIVDQARGDRLQLLCGSLMAALTCNVVLGAVFGVLSTSYILLTLGYTAICGIVLQLVFHKVHDSRGHVYQNMLGASFILFKGMTFYLIGNYIE